MTTVKPSATTTQQPWQGARFRLPEPPKREPDELTSYDHLYKPGNAYLLIEHFGNPETTLVEADRWIVASPEFNKARARRPDLLIAFDVSAADYRASNGYIVSEQGKPPDFVLEVASESTAEADVGQNATTMPSWASRSTGGLTRPASSTGRGWLETDW